MRVRRRTLIWGIVIAIGLAVASPFAFFAFYIATSGGSGSADEAVRLRVIVEPIPDPEAGSGADREYAAKRFKNGEWVLGVGRDSHALMAKYCGGGTVVVKDSRGQVRCFFGHVCGSGGHEGYMSQAGTLDEFYTRLVEDGIFTEYQWP